MWTCLCRFPVLSGAALVLIGLGARALVVTDHVLLLLCLTYAVVLYVYFVKTALE